MLQDKDFNKYFENGAGYNWNPFIKGYLSNEDRKKPIRWYGTNFIFFSKTADLSDGLIIYKNDWEKYPQQENSWEKTLINECMKFAIIWREAIHSHLNGFPGLDTVNITIDPDLGLNFFNINL